MLTGPAPWHGPIAVMVELRDAESIACSGMAGVGGSLVAKHGGDPNAWPDLIQKLADNDALARALRLVVTEFWRNLRVVEKRLGYGPDVSEPEAS